jgi:hypothetical protein
MNVPKVKDMRSKEFRKSWMLSSDIMSSDIGRSVDGRWVFYGIMLFNNTQSGSLSVLNNSIGLSKSTAPLNEPEFVWLLE